MDIPCNIISLGAGVQSSTMAMMAAAGHLKPMPHCAIFADTQAEPANVYIWLDWLEKQLPFPTFRVSAGSLTSESLRLRVSKKTGQTYNRTLIPAFVDAGDGKKSLLGRKCTAEFKVRQLTNRATSEIAALLPGWKTKHRRAYKEFLYAKKNKIMVSQEMWLEMQADALVISWIGISADEAHRMKPGRVPWIRQIWPLVESNITRIDCLAWWDNKNKNYADRPFYNPPRSACKYCPFHSDDEWVRQKLEEPEEFAESVKFDHALRYSCEQATGTARLRGKVYLHSSLKSLDEVVFKDVKSHIQNDNFGNECEGMCGV